jgi:tryptophan-rich sensory protein
MSIQVSRAIVRIAAVITVLACGCFITFIVADVYDLILRHDRMRNGLIILLGLWSVLPILFICESIRAWRYVPKGIESLSLLWMISGIGGILNSLFFCFVDLKVQDAVFGVIGLCLLICALWMTRQAKKLHDVT